MVSDMAEPLRVTMEMGPTDWTEMIVEMNQSTVQILLDALEKSDTACMRFFFKQHKGEYYLGNVEVHPKENPDAG